MLTNASVFKVWVDEKKKRFIIETRYSVLTNARRSVQNSFFEIFNPLEGRSKMANAIDYEVSQIDPFINGQIIVASSAATHTRRETIMPFGCLVCFYPFHAQLNNYTYTMQSFMITNMKGLG